MCQTGGVKPDNLVIHPINAGLTLLHQFRLEAAVYYPAGDCEVSDVSAYGSK